MEADLQRFYGVDYRDRWRLDDRGRPRLTLRRLCVLVEHLPPEAAVSRAAREHEPSWSLTDRLLADVWSALTGKRHPEMERALEPFRQRRDAERAELFRRKTGR